MAQIGTIEIETQNSNTTQVPVFELGDSLYNVYEIIQVETGSGTGFIPITSSQSMATFPHLQIQTSSNGVCYLHDDNHLEPETYTTSFYSAFDGNITTVHPQHEVPETDPIAIQSAEIQWRGVQTTETHTKTKTVDKSSIRTFNSGDVHIVTSDLPNGGDIVSHEVEAGVVGDGGDEFDWVADGKPWGDESGRTTTWDSFDTKYTSNSDNSGTDYTGQEVEGRYKKLNNTPADHQVYLHAKTKYEYNKTYDTKDPSVSQDVSADAGTVTLSDGETSNWYTLSGLDSGTEDFLHSISGSNEAEFRVKFDYLIK